MSLATCVTKNPGRPLPSRVCACARDEPSYCSVHIGMSTQPHGVLGGVQASGVVVAMLDNVQQLEISVFKTNVASIALLTVGFRLSPAFP